ncbi:hypothetical protein B0H67DRAFT_667586 [Lasiosphaeris hirsuta]|uniref:Uncharacterized protein n=1 Tax=Lasiosphaeris hirsuta TaxID=260670 RepID=A0AA40A7P2_9PEZI|nr:hypothetical protein B0H67DRAFT_667586 [Lasiosphaeris hirsuta]
MVSQQIIWLTAALGAVQAANRAPSETTKDEELYKASTGGSPIPTSNPELVGMELLRRADLMGSNTCGWRADLTCTEYPECGAYVMTSSAAPLTTYTLHGCWLPNYGKTYLMQDFQPTVITSSDMPTSTSPSPSPPPPPPPSSAASSPARTTIIEVAGSPPVGAIVGGAVGGLALLILAAFGLFFLRRRKPAPAPHHDSQAAALAYQNDFHKESPYSPTAPSPTSPTQSVYHSLGLQQPTQTVASVPPLYDPRQSVTSSQGPWWGQPQEPGGTPSPNQSPKPPFPHPASQGRLTRSSQPPTHFLAQAPAPGGEDESGYHAPARAAATLAEVETVHPFGTRSNRAELAGWGRAGGS